MKVLIVKSSYRKGSNSSALADKAAEGAKASGADVQTIDIGRLTISNCRGCYGCMGANADFCVIKDDMHPFYQPVMEADVIVFASPVYWFNICGQAKQFLDRLFAAAMRPGNPFSKKSFAALFSFEDTDAVKSGCANALRMFQDICGLTKARWLGAAYGSVNDANAAAGKPELLAEAFDFGKAIATEA